MGSSDTDGGYQVMPPLSDEEFSSLKADIAEKGVLVPVEYDERGRILDGHHRVRACKELGIEKWPMVKRTGLSEDHKRAHAMALNLARRHLSKEQRAGLWVEMRKDGMSYRQIAEADGTVSEPTVRRSIASNDAVDLPQTVTGKDGKARAASKPKAKFVSVDEQEKRERRETVKKERAEALREAVDRINPHSDADIRHCSMAELFAAGFSADVVITDPPYPKEYLPLYEDLARLCADAKIPIVAAMAGQSYLPEIYAAMSKHLKYRWTLAYLTPGGQAVQQWQAKVNTFWKPVLLFGNADTWIGDVCRSDVNNNDKRFHHWGQSESGMRDLVSKLSLPGQTVCDPFTGGGTTAVASLSLGRKFIGCDIDKRHVAVAVARCAELAELMAEE